MQKDSQLFFLILCLFSADHNFYLSLRDLVFEMFKYRDKMWMCRFDFFYFLLIISPTRPCILLCVQADCITSSSALYFSIHPWFQAFTDSSLPLLFFSSVHMLCCALCTAGGSLLCVCGTLWKHMDGGQHGSISLNFKLNLHTWQISVVLYLQYRPEIW